MNLDALKTQVLAMSAVKGDSISSLITSFIIVTLIEQLFGFVPLLKELIIGYIDQFKTKVSTVAKSQLDTTKEKSSSISFSRIYNSDSGNALDYEVADCLIELATSLDNSKSLVCTKFYYIKHCKEIMINNKISIQFTKIHEKDGIVALIDFDIFSYEYTLTDLQNFINKTLQNSRIKRQNKIGDKLYYFNEIPKSLPKFNGNVDYGLASKSINFNMTPFHTNKSLNNVYGESFTVIKNRVDFFTKNEDWYKEKGIPYTLGILVHGPPGSGKTSCIKAVANTTKRHIVNITLSENTTKTQLRNLFFEDKLTIEKSNAHTETLMIPCEKRIYVIEDIDCLSDIVTDRAIKQKEQEMKLLQLQIASGFAEEKKEEKSEIKVKTPAVVPVSQNPARDLNDERINLSFLLNLFDGVLETPGRILIISSNYPERIDKALIRPGRIDLNIKFGYCSKETIREMVEKIYDISKEDLDSYDFADNVYTPAEVNQYLFNHIDNKYKGIDSLLQDNVIQSIKKVELVQGLTPVESVTPIEIIESEIKSEKTKKDFYDNLKDAYDDDY
jgi:hypothetical protein